MFSINPSAKIEAVILGESSKPVEASICPFLISGACIFVPTSFSASLILARVSAVSSSSSPSWIEIYSIELCRFDVAESFRTGY